MVEDFLWDTTQPLATPLYLICEIEWEYQDNGWRRLTGEGGIPRRAYLSREVAEQVCHNMNREYRRKNFTKFLDQWNEDARSQELIQELFQVTEVKEC